jgi:hypothetical protein
MRGPSLEITPNQFVLFEEHFKKLVPLVDPEKIDPTFFGFLLGGFADFPLTA